MEKIDLINAFAIAMDKHTKSIEDVQCIMHALDEISELMQDKGYSNTSLVGELGCALRTVNKSLHDQPFVDTLQESVFNDIHVMVLAKHHHSAFQTMCWVVSDITDNEELMSSSETKPS